MRIPAWIRRSIVGRLLVAYFDSQTPNYAAGLAFNAFLTMFPIILGLVALVGIVLQDRAVLRAVERAIVTAFPLDAQAQVLKTQREVAAHAGTIGIVAVLGLLWSGTSLFASLEFALNRVYGLQGRHPLRQRLRGLRLILVFAVGIVVTVFLNAAIGFIQGQLLNITAYLNVVAGWLVISYLLIAVYRLAPNLRLTVREVLPGAIAAGALIELLTLAFPLIWRLTHRVSLYTQGVTFFFFLATWLYLTCQLLLMGAVLNRLLHPLTPASAEIPGRELTPPALVR